MKRCLFLLLNLIIYIGRYDVNGRYLLVDVKSEANIESGPTVMKTGAKDGKMIRIV